jgi:hypothetical protein
MGDWNFMIAVVDVGLVTGIVLLCALAVAIAELLKLRKLQEFKTITELHEVLNTDELQKGMRFIYQNHNRPGGLIPFHSENELRSVEQVLNAYDLIALRTQQGVVGLDAVLATDWRLVLPLWKCTLPFIEKQRELRGCIPNEESQRNGYKGIYKGPFQWLVEEAEKYRKRNNLELPKTFSAKELVRGPEASKALV